MKNVVDVDANILSWAISRAGHELQEFTIKIPRVKEWLEGTKKPTVKQLEDFSKQVHVPFGYLFLHEPPKENLPIPFFRTKQSTLNSPILNVNVYDTILLLQRRQDWLSEYLREQEFEPLSFVGSFNPNANFKDIVSDIRSALNLEVDWAKKFNTWQKALDTLVHTIESLGVIVVFNGVVENNNRRKIPVEDCRGFVLVDDIAPFMFINNNDSKSAQMFTLLHELAHLWLGRSAGFEAAQLLPANDPVEQLCDKVAAEFLVPENLIVSEWDVDKSMKANISKCTKLFKVSEVVVARRALDIGKISKSQFFQFYYQSRKNESDFKKQSKGGNFYSTTLRRLGHSFSIHVKNAVKSGELPYRDAYKLTSLKGDTFQKYIEKHL